MTKTNSELEFQKLVKEENYSALFDWAYEQGTDNLTKQEAELIIEAYHICMNHDIPMAANNIGSMYYHGKGVEEDHLTAIKYYEKACEGGVPLAYSNLGYCYYYGGNNVEINYDKSYQIFLEGSALFNDPECLYKLGDHYRYARGVTKNEEIAFHLYVRALRVIRSGEEKECDCLGDIQYRMGECLLHGIGVNQDILTALRHLNMAQNSLYERINKDRYVKSSIDRCKELVEEAQNLLENVPLYTS